MTRSIDPTRRPSFLASGGSTYLLLIRLVLAILLEGVCSLAQLVFFPLHRSAHRARIRSAILGPSRFRAAPVFVACTALLAASGCSAPQPGSSFQKQVDETVWSAAELIRMDDAQASMEDDLQELAGGISAEDLRWDLEQILLSPDALGSLEDDLRVFSDPEIGQLQETFEMLGW